MSRIRVCLVAGVLMTGLVATTPTAAVGATPGRGCDFNGDGFGDLVVGADKESAGGELTGALNVLYGSAEGATTVADDYWTPRSKGMPATATTFRGSACGDFDDDDFHDLAIRGWGAVTVLRGAARGLTTAGARRIAFPEMGSSHLAVGDFNGDGADDLAVGAPEVLKKQGTVDVLYGGAAGLSASSSQRINQPEGGGQRVACGGSVVAGDFNNDGFDDVVWSCERGYDHAAQDWYGPVLRQALGSADGVEPVQSQPLAAGYHTHLAVGDFNGDGNDDVALPGAARYGTATSGLVDGEVRAFGITGRSVAGGDFNGDGIDDLALGDHETNTLSFTRVRGGTVIVIDGGRGGLDESTAEAWNPHRRGVRGDGLRGDQFGWAVSASDANGDGRDDLLVGIRLRDIVVKGTTVNNAGAAHLFYGSGAGLTARGDRLLSQNTRGVRGVAERSDLFGATVAHAPSR